MRIVAYVRVSTNGQVERGHGLEDQEERIRRWSRTTGHRLIAVHRDAGVSGAKEAPDRPGLTEALECLRRGDAGGLVVDRLDRLARALTVQEACLAQVWQDGAVVYTVDHGEVRPDDPDDPMRTAMRQMVGVFSQLDKAMLVKRLGAARRDKAARGGYAHGGVPFGYRVEDGRVVKDDTEQRAVRLARRLHRQGKSLRAIASALDAASHRPRRAAHWWPNSVARLLK